MQSSNTQEKRGYVPLLEDDGRDSDIATLSSRLDTVAVESAVTGSPRVKTVGVPVANWGTENAGTVVDPRRIFALGPSTLFRPEAIASFGVA